MYVRCPHCHDQVEVLVPSSTHDILCSNCNHKFDVVVAQSNHNDRPTHSPTTARRERIVELALRRPLAASLSICTALFFLVGLAFMGWLWLRGDPTSTATTTSEVDSSKAVELANEEFEEASALLQRGRNQFGLGMLKEAEQTLLQAATTLRRLSQQFPTALSYQIELAQTHYQLAILYDAAERPDAAVEQQLLEIEALKQLVGEDSTVVPVEKILAVKCTDLGLRLQAIGKLGPASEQFRSAVSITERLLAENQGALDYRRDLVNNYYHLGRTLIELEAFEEAELLSQLALEGATSLADNYPYVAEYQTSLALNLLSLGKLFEQTGRHDASQQSYQEAIAILEQLALENPNVADCQSSLAMARTELADHFNVIGRVQEAARQHRLAAEIGEQLVADYPSTADYRRQLAASYLAIATIQNLAHDHSAKLHLLVSARFQFEQLLGSNPEDAQAEHSLADTLNRLAKLLASSQDPSVQDEKQAFAIAIRACELNEWKSGDSFATLIDAYSASVAQDIKQSFRPGPYDR